MGGGGGREDLVYLFFHFSILSLSFIWLSWFLIFLSVTFFLVLRYEVVGFKFRVSGFNGEDFEERRGRLGDARVLV